MTTRRLALDASTYVPHGLHGPDRHWRETNCYVDLWIEVLHSLGFDPLAALSFTVTQDFEGDQFTFFKFPLEDLQRLYGLTIQELAIYESVEIHAIEQLRRGRLVLVEVDSFYLPDTVGISYRQQHTKTTLAINEIDIDERKLGYFHNAGYFRLEGDDYDGVFRKSLKFAADPELLFPYVEFVKESEAQLTGQALRDEALALLKGHLARRPSSNPIACFRDRLPGDLDRLIARPIDYFHVYTFNSMRQLGANFELLGNHLGWLEDRGEAGLEAAKLACSAIAETAKATQFQLARVAHKKKVSDFSPVLDAMERAYDTVMTNLAARFG